MKVLVTGGLGFVGRHICRSFLDQGAEVTAIGRSPNPNLIPHPQFNYRAADTTQTGDWQEGVGQADIIVNLTGKTIFARWTDAYKQQIYDSRILTTRNIVQALPEGSRTTLCSTSAVGFYGDGGETVLTEASALGSGFLADIARDWEAEAQAAEKKGARVNLMRFGVVLGRGGGALVKMIPAFKMFAGGPMGSGSQWMPWIHIDDLVSAVHFLVDHQTPLGAVNFCAPHPVRNHELAATLAKVLKRPSAIPVPAFLLRTVLGELSEAFLDSQRVLPERLTAAGFSFEYPKLKDALTQLVG
jgi:uncharacterized protein (TIGR01777 family)